MLVVSKTGDFDLGSPFMADLMMIETAGDRENWSGEREGCLGNLCGGIVDMHGFQTA